MQNGESLSLDHQQSRRIELDLLLEAIYRKYGYDFRNYSRASVKRRIERRMLQESIASISELQRRVLYEKEFFETLLLDLSVNVTEMFRDPGFYRAVKQKVLPCLKSCSFIRLWHAGCSTGEEVYSMAILLKEEELYEKSRIYATDFNEKVLRSAKEGIFPSQDIQLSTSNYRASGGNASFADYYTARYEHAIMNRELKDHIVFSDHNLATDRSFGEMEIIVCRNVLIYFDKTLQSRALTLFRDSLSAGGFLCLGTRESIRFADCSADFEDFDKEYKIYRKKQAPY